jgi:molecular chaperone GrpE
VTDAHGEHQGAAAGSAASGAPRDAAAGEPRAPQDAATAPDPGAPDAADQAAADQAAGEPESVPVPEPDPLAEVTAQRDEYLDRLRYLQADFENYKKRVAKQQADQAERQVERLVERLLPVLDTADLALAHGGGEDVKQVWAALFDALQREGLERLDPAGRPFDPNVHDAVAREPAQPGQEGQEVAEVLRAGYRWKSRVLRPAMVKVRG